MCLCYLFSAKTARQLVNQKAVFFTKRIDLHNESIRIANWNALVPSSVAENEFCFKMQPSLMFSHVYFQILNLILTLEVK